MNHIYNVYKNDKLIQINMNLSIGCYYFPLTIKKTCNRNTYEQNIWKKEIINTKNNKKIMCYINENLTIWTSKFRIKTGFY